MFSTYFNSLILIVFETVTGIPNSPYSWIWFGINLVLTFLLYSFAVFAGMFTGHLAAQAIFYYIFNFLALFLETVIRSILNNFLFGYSSYYSSRTFDAWSPLYYLSDFYRGFRSDQGNIAATIGYLVAAIIFLVSAYYLYKKRHMEVATDVISYSFVKPVFKYGVAFCSAALIGSIIVSILNVHQNLVAYIITYLIGGFIDLFLAEMLICVKHLKFLSHIKGILYLRLSCLCFFAVSILTCMVMSAGYLNIAKWK